jgi:hypothetical protein
MCDDRYGLFKQEHEGPVWRSFASDLEETKSTAQKLADKEQAVFFIYCFHSFSEVARFKPSKTK